MKKILLVLMCLVLFSLNSVAQISSISGNQSVITGELWMYSLYFNTPLATDTEFIINTSKYGVFNNSQDTVRAEFIKKGTSRYDFFIKWGQVATNEATISAYKQGDSPSNVKKLKVKVLKASCNGNYQTEDGSITISGPEETEIGRNVTYSINAGEGAQVNWSYDEAIFEKVAETNKSITLKVKDKIWRTDIKAEVVSIDENTCTKYILKGYFFVSVYSILPNFSIKASDNYVCLNNECSYEIEGLNPSINPTVQWSSNENCLLLSGQGTTKVRYRTVKNGEIHIKAIVSYEGNDIVVESQGHAGPPSLRQSTSTNIKTNNHERFSFDRLIYGYVLGGETYTWKSYPSDAIWEIKDPDNTSSLGTNVRMIKAGLLHLRVTNKCGSLDRFIYAYNSFPSFPLYLIGNDAECICNGEEVKYITYIPDGGTITWQSTPTMTLVSGQGTHTATYLVSETTTEIYGSVKAIISYDGKDYTSVSSDIWVGPPTDTFQKVTGRYPESSKLFKGGDVETFQAIGVPSRSSEFVWETSGAQIISQSGTSVTVKFLNPQSPFHWNARITIKTKNKCGIADFGVSYSAQVENNPNLPDDISLPDPNDTLPIIPRPRPKATLNLPIVTPTSSSTPSPVTVKVYTFNTGTLVYSEKNVTDFNIQNTTLKDGIYIVVSTDQNGETKSEKVVKTRN